MENVIKIKALVHTVETITTSFRVTATLDGDRFPRSFIVPIKTTLWYKLSSGNPNKLHILVF